MLLFRGGDNMKDLFQYVAAVETKDTYELLFANSPQATKSFGKWPKEISNAIKLIDFMVYDRKQAAVDAIILQTSSPKFREKALQGNIMYRSS